MQVCVSGIRIEPVEGRRGAGLHPHHPATKIAQQLSHPRVHRPKQKRAAITLITITTTASNLTRRVLAEWFDCQPSLDQTGWEKGVIVSCWLNNAKGMNESSDDTMCTSLRLVSAKANCTLSG